VNTESVVFSASELRAIVDALNEEGVYDISPVSVYVDDKQVSMSFTTQYGSGATWSHKPRSVLFDILGIRDGRKTR
jgi:hypothetical protein